MNEDIPDRDFFDEAFEDDMRYDAYCDAMLDAEEYDEDEDEYQRNGFIGERDFWNWKGY